MAGERRLRPGGCWNPEPQRAEVRAYPTRIVARIESADGVKVIRAWDVADPRVKPLQAAPSTNFRGPKNSRQGLIV